MHKSNIPQGIGLKRKELNKLSQQFRRMGVKYPYAFAKDLYYFLQVSNKNHISVSVDQWTQYFTIDKDNLLFNLELLTDKCWVESFSTSGITPGYNWAKFLKSLDDSTPNLTLYKINFIKQQIEIMNQELEKLTRYL